MQLVYTDHHNAFVYNCYEFLKLISVNQFLFAIHGSYGISSEYWNVFPAEQCPFTNFRLCISVVVSNEPELQSLTINIRIANWFYAGDYEDRDTQRFVEAQNKICTSVRDGMVEHKGPVLTHCGQDKSDG